MNTTLSNWMKAAGVAICGQPRSPMPAPPGDETPGKELPDSECTLNTERDITATEANHSVRWGHPVPTSALEAGQPQLIRGAGSEVALDQVVMS